MTSVSVKPDGRPGLIYSAAIRTDPSTQPPYEIFPPVSQSGLDMDFKNYIHDLESEITKAGNLYDARADQERAILVSVSGEKKEKAQSALNELYELAVSNDIYVIESILQQKSKPDPKFLMGKGKLSDVSILAMQKSATMLVFDQELTPAQVRSITDYIDLKVIDRTQLILDIFSQRAKSREGKLQVELAQLKYLLPRLATKNTAMSRLTGGIGGRGPGETKLEINRRRARESIEKLTKDLKLVHKHREQQRSRRNRMGLPVFSIIGYTNAGKSTLLNSLTQSEIYTKDQLFATLDPSSRRLRFPQEIEAIITDTVGFIRDLPKELMTAFRATLEELESADVLVHVIDISNPACTEQIESVERIIDQLKLESIPVINVLNKMDVMDAETVEIMAKKFNGIPVCAKDRKTLGPLFEKMAEHAVLKLRGE
jgi:GTP-binding protein HflX